MNNQSTPINAVIPDEIKKQIEDAAYKEEIYPRKYGSGTREGYNTMMLYEINSERSECFEKGAIFGYQLAAQPPSPIDKQEHWRKLFKDDWFKANDNLPVKQLNELWKETERAADMAYKYIVSHLMDSKPSELNSVSTFDEIYEKHTGTNMELQYVATPKEVVFAIAEEYASKLKPINAVVREEEIRSMAMDFVENLSEESYNNRTGIHFTEDTLVQWLCDFASQFKSKPDAVDDEAVWNEFYSDIDALAREIDEYDYGLPMTRNEWLLQQLKNKYQLFKAQPGIT